ncbi:hypothetical protein H2248_011526 [Termitomyces sp. 'cryptogamus']|nr:hypothetical protein H2248_011526 [Termitomyces sp. 'cryptogamus']
MPKEQVDWSKKAWNNPLVTLFVIELLTDVASLQSSHEPGQAIFHWQFFTVYNNPWTWSERLVTNDKKEKSALLEVSYVNTTKAEVFSPAEDRPDFELAQISPSASNADTSTKPRLVHH